MSEEQMGTELATLEEGQLPTHIETEAIQPDALAVMEQVMIDTQIATAKRYPRSLSQFQQRARSMATLDEETAQSCIYRRPVGKENGKDVYAEGESIRLAEIVAASYGNIRVRSMITEITPTHVKAVAMAHDLETNYAMAAEVVESTLNKWGKPYSERMRLVVAKAAQSKAIRDAIFRVVPKSMCKAIALAAKDVALGKGLTLQQRRERTMGWIHGLGIGAYRVFAALGITGVEELMEGQLLTLTGLRTAIKDGDITVEEAFPEPRDDEGEEPKRGSEAVKAKLRNGKAAKEVKPKEEVPPAPAAPTETEPTIQEQADQVFGEGAVTEAPAEPPMRFVCGRCHQTFPVLPAKGLCPGDGKNKCLGSVTEILE